MPRLDELAEWPAHKLKALTDAELEAICKEKFGVTRPEQAPKPQKETKSVAPVMSSEKQAAFKLLQEQGIDMSIMFRKKRK